MISKYNSLEQRVVASKYEVFPDFFASDEIDELAQKKFYFFIKGVFFTLYNQPSLLFPSLHEDYGFPSAFTIKGSNHEETMNIMRKNLRLLEVLIAFLWNVGNKGVLQKDHIEFKDKVSKRYQEILSRNGIKYQNNCFYGDEDLLRGWSWFATKSDLNRIKFERCIFEETHDYLTNILQSKVEKEIGDLDEVISWLNASGYQKAYTLTKFLKDETYMVSYIKNITDKKALIGFPYMGDAAHIGFSMEYRYMASHPYFCTLRIPGMRKILGQFDSLDDQVKKVILSYNKRCDGCRYCVQTDKTHTRPLGNISINNEKMCPYFPGFNYSYRDVSKQEANEILALLKFIEAFNFKDK